jgi:hypothetical protein
VDGFPQRRTGYVLDHEARLISAVPAHDGHELGRGDTWIAVTLELVSAYSRPLG